MSCARCGRDSHTAHDCFAKKHINGGKVNDVHYVYSLNLEGGRKYVGKTDDIKRRMDEHFGGSGSKWTKKYKPTGINHVQVCRSSETQAKAETIVYHKLAGYHGKSVVRGAGHTSAGCSRCGRESHNIKNCYASYHENGQKLN